MPEKVRCFGDGDPLMENYHDEEWGVPVHDSRLLFEKLVLDGFQAGLSWRTVLHKRDNFRRAFDGFDPERIAGYGKADQARLLADPGIIRNKLKVAAAISNAQAYLDLAQAEHSFADFLWSFTGHEVIRRAPESWEEVPAASPESNGNVEGASSQGV